MPLAAGGAPSARTAHAAGFVAGKYVVFGGSLTNQGPAVTSTGAYDVSSDTWSVLAPLASARCAHNAVSTGTEVFTFGGLTHCGNGTTIGPGLERFVPDGGAGVWVTVNLAGALSPRYSLAGTWTGSEFFLYGGGNNTLPTLATGAAFSPSSMAWSDVSCSIPNCDRGGGAVFKDGSVLRFFGGLFNPIYPTPPPGIEFATSGLAFDLASRTWSTWPHPSGTAEHLGGRFADDGRRLYFLKSTDIVTIYDRTTSSWIADDTAPMPSGLCIDAATAWTGSEMVAWSGSCGGSPVNVGGRYQPKAF